MRNEWFHGVASAAPGAFNVGVCREESQVARQRCLFSSPPAASPTRPTISLPFQPSGWARLCHLGWHGGNRSAIDCGMTQADVRSRDIQDAPGRPWTNAQHVFDRASRRGRTPHSGVAPRARPRLRAARPSGWIDADGASRGAPHDVRQPAREGASTRAGSRAARPSARYPICRPVAGPDLSPDKQLSSSSGWFREQHHGFDAIAGYRRSFPVATPPRAAIPSLLSPLRTGGRPARTERAAPRAGGAPGSSRTSGRGAPRSSLHALACTCGRWHAPAATGMHLRALACTCGRWHAPAATGMHLRPLACTPAGPGMHLRAPACSSRGHTAAKEGPAAAHGGSRDDRSGRQSRCYRPVSRGKLADARSARRGRRHPG
ncbi:uncharacterized protein SOCE836_020190 [Sorangium cellulosum]|uniref:Uncharacterized protein n=1 Tax=Sorangium cellulosum TaxID=56 RepID=A0A4P2QJ42_SORCE|nr:uncharacterized protein SOCE836_020190 [Sorangium cellulosum]WCQ89313.1 hypothetical protein NQZ70_02000 [Sorangium sp. Soce836]